MRNIYILMVILIAFGSGVLIGTYMNHVDEADFTYFKRYGQYEPAYMNYTDEQMLYECERHHLVYDYEEGQCT